MNQLEEYKLYCIWPYDKWDIIEVLIANDIDDWYSFEPETRYYYIKWPFISCVWKFNRNSTNEIVELLEYKTTFDRECFGNILWNIQFDASYIISHRKIEIENHIWYKPKTKERDIIEYIEYK